MLDLEKHNHAGENHDPRMLIRIVIIKNYRQGTKLFYKNKIDYYQFSA